MWLLRVLIVVAILTPFTPASLGYFICRVVGIAFWAFNLTARRNVLANLRQVDPNLSWLQRERTAIRVFTTVATNYYDLIRLRSVDRDSFLERAEVVGMEHVERALEKGKGAIILSVHQGNFSVMARLSATIDAPAALIAERVDPPDLFQYMARLRSALGVKIIPPGPGSLRPVLGVLRENGLLLLAGDRDITGNGTLVSFFGRTTRLPSGPAALAMRTGAALIPAHTIRVGGNRSKVFISEPITIENGSDCDEQLVRNVHRAARSMERMIRLDPGQWAVLQSVWPPTTVYGRSEGLGSADEAVLGAEERAADGVRHRAD